MTEISFLGELTLVGIYSMFK